MWTDLFLDRTLSPHAVQAGVAHAFAVAPGAVLLADATQPLPDSADTSEIIVQLAQNQGEFPLQVTIIPQTDALRSNVSGRDRSESMIARLSALWQARCLYSDDSLDPYSWLLIAPSGRVEQVQLDPRRLDEDDAMVIRGAVGTSRMIATTAS